MANCTKCGTRIGIFNASVDNDGLCLSCGREEEHIKKAQQERAEQEERAIIETVLLTTETAPNLKIIKRVEIITAEVAYGMHIFKDLFAGVRDIVGGRSEAVQKTMRDARRTALFELKKEAKSVGANAVVGVDLDYVELSTGSNMVMLVASGTAVVIGE